MPSPLFFVEIIEDSTGRVERSFNVTRMSPSQRERLVDGITRKLDHEKFTVRERTETRKVTKEISHAR